MSLKGTFSFRDCDGRMFRNLSPDPREEAAASRDRSKQLIEIHLPQVGNIVPAHVHPTSEQRHIFRDFLLLCRPLTARSFALSIFHFTDSVIVTFPLPSSSFICSGVWPIAICIASPPSLAFMFSAHAATPTRQNQQHEQYRNQSSHCILLAKPSQERAVAHLDDLSLDMPAHVGGQEQAGIRLVDGIALRIGKVDEVLAVLQHLAPMFHPSVFTFCGYYIASLIYNQILVFYASMWTDVRIVLFMSFECCIEWYFEVLSPSTACRPIAVYQA